MARGIDDRHEVQALPLLKPLFDSAVTEPVRLHVDAKRYLCAVRAEYWASLLPGSHKVWRCKTALTLKLKPKRSS